jgi:hydroxylamine reductase
MPLSSILSRSGQKAVAVLPTLPYLGIKNIRPGPSLRALVAPKAPDVPVMRFNIQPATMPGEDQCQTGVTAWS